MDIGKRVELKDLKKKFRNLSQTRFTLKEQGLFLPKIKEYDFSFLIQFLKGEKEILRIPASEEYVIPSFTKINFLNHDHLEEIFKAHRSFYRFLPEQISFQRVPKRLLFAIIFQENRQVYDELKNTYKKLKDSKASPSISNCYVTVSSEVFSFLCSLPDVGEADTRRKSNFIKKAKKGMTVKGVDIDKRLENLEVVDELR